jgi:hypothetical protein
MARNKSDVEMIAAPNLLQIKIGGPIGQGDLHLIEKADEALKDMRANFSQWLEEEVGNLETAASIVQKNGLNSIDGERLFIRAHDLRGLGTTYEFPIITRLAKSMTKLIDIPEKREKASLGLVLAHVGAIRAAMSQNIRDSEDSVAEELAIELEKQTAVFAEPWKDD